MGAFAGCMQEAGEAKWVCPSHSVPSSSAHGTFCGSTSRNGTLPSTSVRDVTEKVFEHGADKTELIAAKYASEHYPNQEAEQATGSLGVLGACRIVCFGAVFVRGDYGCYKD